MEFKVDRKDFLSALSIGAALAGRSKVLPVLDNVKIRVKGAYLSLISMDGDSAIQKKTTHKGSDEDGEFAVNASDIIKAFKALKDDVVTLTYSSEKNALDIKHGKGKIILSAITTEDFPVISKGENQLSFKISSEIFYSWLNSARSFVASDNVRPIMCGMYLDVRSNVATVCASDGSKMFTDSTDLIVSCPDTETVIPSAVLGVIQGVINGTDGCVITIDSVNTTFSVDDAKMSVRNISGRYPNFRGVIPTHDFQNIEIDVEKDDFVGSVSRVSICSNSTSLVKMCVSGSDIFMEADNTEFGKSAKEDICCAHNGDDITIGFKHDAMISLLSNVASDNVLITMSTPERAIVVRDYEFPNKVLLIMPCLLS